MSDYEHGDTKWFVHDRFGMFIHWGIYSQAARHEKFQAREELPPEVYERYADTFDPDMFRPAEWAAMARDAGMKYFVITTKHHDGFCMWDTKFTDFKVTNTPAKRDLLREMVDAFRAEGIRVGFYYSLLDWHHPDFTIDQPHPMRNSPNRESLNQKRVPARYAKYMRDQLEELMTQYGKIDILWLDYSYPREVDKGREYWEREGKDRHDWESEKLLALVRKHQPEIILDNRLDLPGSEDIATPEQYLPDTGMRDSSGKPIVWEGCHTFSGSWGYYRDEHCWKSSRMCVELLIQHVSKGGNLLLNVGPTAAGYIDSRATKRLKEIGAWMKYNYRAIYGCAFAPSEFTPPESCVYTYNPETRRLYLHLLSYPFKHIHLPNLAGKVKYAQLLADRSEIITRDSSVEVWKNLASPSPEKALTLELPTVLPEWGTEVPVIELFLT